MEKKKVSNFSLRSPLVAAKPRISQPDLGNRGKERGKESASQCYKERWPHEVANLDIGTPSQEEKAATSGPAIQSSKQ